MTTDVLAPTTSADRWVGALAHLGVPFMGPFLPLGVWAMNEQPFRKEHARQALTFQLGFIAIWVVISVLSILVGVLPPSVMVVVLGLGLLSEMPQIALPCRAGHRSGPRRTPGGVVRSAPLSGIAERPPGPPGHVAASSLLRPGWCPQLSLVRQSKNLMEGPLGGFPSVRSRANSSVH
jgi:hypothetical protein